VSSHRQQLLKLRRYLEGDSLPSPALNNAQIAGIMIFVHTKVLSNLKMKHHYRAKVKKTQHLA
jgi:hypothetical protein